MQEIPEEESELSDKVHKLLLEANGGGETLTAAAASEYLKEAGLGLRFVQASRFATAMWRLPGQVKNTHLSSV